MQVFQAALEAFLGTEHPEFAAIDKTFVLEDIDSAVATFPRSLQRQLTMLVRALEFTGPLTCLMVGRFSEQPVEKRQQILLSWSQSRFALLGVAVNSLKMLIMSFWWAQPGTWKYLGYDGPFLDQKEVPYFESFLSMPLFKLPLPLLPKVEEDKR